MSICICFNCDKPAIYDNMRVCRMHKNYISEYKTSFPMPSLNSNEPSLPSYCTDSGDLFKTETTSKSTELCERELKKYALYDKAYTTPNK